ncbi:MAG: diaminopimelate dehydrogenase [Clostridiales bacterium]|nr:diaminopimelate dehydrogenase [Clostridiales bacterium]
MNPTNSSANSKIRVAIVGYGNLGKAAEHLLSKTTDMELVSIFTRRDPATLKTQSSVPVVHNDDMCEWTDKVDIAILCLGSATDLPDMGPKFAALFNTVDSFDTHAKAAEYAEKMNEAAAYGDTIAMTSIGWDPGLFSLMRLMIGSVLPTSKVYTFWGKGVSQGHSDAIRRIKGVKDARQYTVPVESALWKIREGETPDLTTREKHTRECYVVTEEGADQAAIEAEIKSMPNYFADYDTTVHFISQEELLRDHSKLPHGGSVIGVGETSEGTKQVVEFSLNLDSNPEFTASVLIAYARAAYRMWKNGETGYKNFSDVPPKFLSPLSNEEIIKGIL